MRQPKIGLAELTNNFIVFCETAQPKNVGALRKSGREIVGRQQVFGQIQYLVSLIRYSDDKFFEYDAKFKKIGEAISEQRTSADGVRSADLKKTKNDADFRRQQI